MKEKIFIRSVVLLISTITVVLLLYPIFASADGDLDQLTPVSQPNLPAFFVALASSDKQLIIVPRAGHALIVQKPRLRFHSEVAKWFSLE